MTSLTTGVPALDGLVDQVRVGDNLVFITSGGADDSWLVDAFIEAVDKSQLVVIDSGGRHQSRVAATLLDWTSRSGVDAPTARAQLAEADRNIGSGAFYAIDSLTGLAQEWGDPAALDLFLWACPRLFRHRSMALWRVERERHSEAFLRRLTEITQVVVDISRGDDGDVLLEVVKADGRPATVIGRILQAQIDGGRLVAVGNAVADRRPFGDMLRELRESHGVGQAELARRVGISPSALSQAERGVRSVSAETLMRIYDTLGVVLSTGAQPRGYSVSRRSTQTSSVLGPGVTGRRLAGDDVTAWHVTLTARASGRHSLFPVKANEVVIVLQGVLEVDVGGRHETLHEGDSLHASGAAISAWSNPADTPTELIWVIGT